MRRAVREGDETHLISLISRFSGPIPPPEILEHYNQIIPGAAERIMEWTETQTRHRQELESESLKADIAEKRRGQHYALVIALAALVAAVICAWLGFPWASGVIAVATFGAIGTASVLNLVWRSPKKRNGTGAPDS